MVDRRILIGLVSILTLLAGPAHAAMPTIAILDTRLPSDYGPEAARTAEELVAARIQKSGLLQTFSRNDLNTMLGLERRRQLIGAEGGADAAAAAAKALGTDLLAVLDVGAIGDTRVVTLKLLDVKGARIVARVQATISGPPALAGEIPRLVDAALEEWKASVAADGGDVPTAPARKAYEEALQAERDGLWAQPRFERIIEISPDFGPALLWLALTVRQSHVTEGRDYYERATLHQEQLTPNERRLLEAVAPYFADPFDPRVLETRLEDAVEETPDASRLWLQLGRVRHLGKRFPGALEAYRKAVQLEPGAAEAMWLESLVLTHTGEKEAAKAAVERCLRAAPFATNCLGEHAKFAESAGRWNEVEADARRLIAMDASDTAGLRALARARAGLRQPLPLVRGAFERAWAAKPAEENARFWNEVWLHQYDGRYDLAEKRLLDGLQARLDSGDVHRIVSVAAALFEIYQETNQKKPALKLVERITPYVQTGSDNVLGWSRDGARLLLAAVTAWAGGMPRAQYLESWRAAMARVPMTPPPLRAATVLYLSTRTAPSREEALEILAALPKFEGKWPTSSVAERDLGQLYARAGKHEEAIPLLESGLRAWVPLGDELRLDAHLMLARSYEAICDVDNARAAYEDLVARFGAMKPAGVSVDDARKGLRRLKAPCRKQP